MNGTIQNRPGPRRPTKRPSRSTTARSHCLRDRGATASATRPTRTIATSGIGLPAIHHPIRPSATEASSIGDRHHVEARRAARSLPSDDREQRASLRSSLSMCSSERTPITSSMVKPAASASARTRVTKARSRRSCSRGGCACAGVGADERPDAAPGLDDAGALELRVDPRHGVGVDAEIDGELADGRQLVARAAAGRWQSPRAARARAARRSAWRREGRWRRCPLECLY